jgi:hypothetical protein
MEWKAWEVIEWGGMEMDVAVALRRNNWSWMKKESWMTGMMMQ